MPGIQLGFNVPTLIVLLLVLVAIAAALYFYRATLPPIPRKKKILLTTLRACSLSIILLLLCEPLLRLVTSSTRAPVLAVLVDISKSMTMRDSKGSRDSVLRQTLSEAENITTLSRENLRFYAFGSDVRPLESISDSISLTADATDISTALKHLREEKEPLNIRAVLLLSDGSYNLGQNPLYDAEELGIPLFTIGIGDSSEQRDLVITRVATNDLVYNDTEVPVDVTLKSAGLGGERVEVVLSSGGKDLDRKQIVLQDGIREYPVQLSYTPEGEGITKYTIRATSLKGELTSDNNRKVFFARILKSKLRVLMLSGGPSPDVSIIRQTLFEEKNFSVQSLTHKSGRTFFEGQLSQQVLDSADCVVLVGFPTARVPAEVTGSLLATVSARKTSLMFVDGKNVDAAALRPLISVLPFTGMAGPGAEQFVFFEPSIAQGNHPILSSATIPPDAWEKLPPIFRKQASNRAKAEAIVLGTARVFTEVTNDPLISIRSVNGQKSLAVLGYGLWRWRLMAQGNPSTERVLTSFLSNSIRWLTTSEESKPVKVTPAKTLYTQGEPVELFGQVYDASRNPVDNARFTVTVRRDAEEFETILRPTGNGRYEGVFDGLGAGDYELRASASLDGQQLGSDKGRFSVGELALEFLDTRMNAPLLRQLASRTGGKYLAPDGLARLGQDLKSEASFSPRSVESANDLELWNWTYLLAFLVLLLTTEWFLRKRAGML